MLKNPKNADLDKDGKLSSYEKKRGKAIEANMKAKKGKFFANEDKKEKINKIGRDVGKAVTEKRKEDIVIEYRTGKKYQKKGPVQKVNITKSKTGKMIKASMGASVRGFGAARTSGMGLQDENLIPGKSLDYYKDIM